MKSASNAAVAVADAAIIAGASVVSGYQLGYVVEWYTAKWQPWGSKPSQHWSDYY